MEEGMNGGALNMPASFGGRSSYWAVCFIAADLHRSLGKLFSLGGKVNVQPFKVAADEMAVVTDPQGGVFHLIQMSSF